MSLREPLGGSPCRDGALRCAALIGSLRLRQRGESRTVCPDLTRFPHQCPPVLLNDPVNLGKPQTRSLFPGFRCEEGFKDMQADFRGNPLACILDAQNDPSPQGHLWEALFFGRMYVHFTEMKLQSSALFHRIASVDGKVGQDLLHLRRIPIDEVVPRLDVTAYLDVLRDHPCEQLDALLEEGGQIHRVLVARRLATEIKAKHDTSHTCLYSPRNH